MKKINFMPKDICELVQLLEAIQHNTAQFPELRAQATKLIAIVKSMGRWMVCLDASKHALIITWLTTFACIVFEKYGAPRIEQYSIPATFAIIGGGAYSVDKLQSNVHKLQREMDKFRCMSDNILDILKKLLLQQKKEK